MPLSRDAEGVIKALNRTADALSEANRIAIKTNESLQLVAEQLKKETEKIEHLGPHDVILPGAIKGEVSVPVKMGEGGPEIGTAVVLPDGSFTASINSTVLRGSLEGLSIDNKEDHDG